MISFFRKHKFDLILVGSLCTIVLAVFLIFELTKTKGGYVSVAIDGEKIAIYPLSEDGEYKLGNGDSDNYNLLVIKNGSACISEASCPDKLCVNQGKISFNNEQLVCLPNKTVVSIISENEPVSDF